MQAYDFIQVLWVEDDPVVTQSYPLKAGKFGLQLVPYPCWDDAKAALESDYDRWSAIILDAKCKHHRDSKDNAVKFLSEALKDISLLSERKGHIIPWYVLTGGDESEVSDSINDDRLKWDKDWTDSENKNYYSKNVDKENLYRRIRYHAYKSSRIQIQEMYRNVFDAFEECRIVDNAYNALEDLLVPIHFPKTIDNKDYNLKYVEARTVMEYIFRSMSSHGMLPDWGKQVNLSWSGLLLGGISAKDKNDKIVIESKKKILPEVLNRLIKEMVKIIPAFCHSDNDEDNEIKREEYLKGIDNSTFLLKSFSLQLCDIILWYKNYLREHKDKDANMKAWEIKDPKAFNYRKNGSK